VKYRLRISGSGDRFVSEIVPHFPSGQPIAVRTVSGWDNPNAMTFDTLAEAKYYKRLVLSVEGWFAMIEDHPLPPARPETA
tara:strand:+ start:2095 stop:2337 length:243 start_codon:yes stop_codon:yes gene_type:complete